MPVKELVTVDWLPVVTDGKIKHVLRTLVPELLQCLQGFEKQSAENNVTFDLSVPIDLLIAAYFFADIFPDSFAHDGIWRSIQTLGLHFQNSDAVRIGLHAGLSGFGLSLLLWSNKKPNLENSIFQIEELINSTALQWHKQSDEKDIPLHVDHYDLISGMSGVCAVPITLLQRRKLHFLEPFKFLIELSLKEDPFFAFSDSGEASTDCGLAHGLPGPLAALSLAKIYGLELPGLDNAIDRLANWLCSKSINDNWGINWPSKVFKDERDFVYTRAAWCYGAPGVARTLWLAGEAQQHSKFQAIAMSAMEAIMLRPENQLLIDSPTFCHGKAGLLQIVLRFYNDTKEPAFKRYAEKLVDEILDEFDSNATFGFPNLKSNGDKEDFPGLIEGACGVLLSLMSASCQVQPSWDRYFLLS